MAEKCMAPTVHRTMAQQFMAPRVWQAQCTVHDGRAEYGTNSETYRWHSNVWHQGCTVKMAQQFMAPHVWQAQYTVPWHSSLWQPVYG